MRGHYKRNSKLKIYNASLEPKDLQYKQITQAKERELVPQKKKKKKKEEEEEKRRGKGTPLETPLPSSNFSGQPFANSSICASISFNRSSVKG